jgi:hypothetical protein
MDWRRVDGHWWLWRPFQEAHAMMFYRTIKCIASPDGERHVEIQVRDDPLLFRFVEWVRWSGLYPDEASADRDATLSLSWPRKENFS